MLRDSARSILLATGLAMAAISGCATEPALPPITSAEHAKAWDEWKTKRFSILTLPGRPPSYTGLHWLRQGPNTIGADSTNDIRLAGRGVPARVGVLVREGAQVRFEPVATSITVDSAPAVAGWLRTDADSGGASRVNVGTAGFRVLKRVDSVGVRTWDGDKVVANTEMIGIAPLEYFTLQPEWRLAGRFEPRVRPETLAVPTVSGVAEEYVIVGRVASRVGGKPVALTAFKGNVPTDLFFSFSDETSGEETYGFRFLHAALDTATRTVTLDFNYAYNPDCAFSAFTTCPLPPEGNRIGTRIAAGERALRFVKDTILVTRAKTHAARARRPRG